MQKSRRLELNKPDSTEHIDTSGEDIKNTVDTIWDNLINPSGELKEIFNQLKTMARNNALEVLNGLMDRLKMTNLPDFIKARVLNFIYDATYSIETIYYQDQLAQDREEFRKNTKDLGIVGQARELMKIQIARQNEIDSRPNVTYKEPQMKLLHTKLLNEFIIKTSIEDIFLPDLFKEHEELKDSMFMFGFGRLLSEYNKLGASAGSDLDSNIIVGSVVDTNPGNVIICKTEDSETIKQALKNAQKVLDNMFKIDLEIKNFTIMTFNEFETTVTAQNPEGPPPIQFYASIYKDHYRFHIREDTSANPMEVVFLNLIEQTIEASGSSAAQLIYEETLNNSIKYSIGIIHGQGDTEDRRLSISVKNPVTNKVERKKVKEVIGSGEGGDKDWYFSMKYTVNRLYDFLYKMESINITPEQLGLTTRAVLEIKNLNNMMLVLQNYVFRLHPEDCAYLSAEDFKILCTAKEYKDFREDFSIIKARSKGDVPLSSLFASMFGDNNDILAEFANWLDNLLAGGDYKKAGYTFFTEIDKRMFAFYQKISESPLIKNNN
ncbi:MAG: hypothetical protein LBE13_13835 [Bacteroidales bacterium]|jgi:hypothetical protein|nr:hypothetical protein [Bacteroidales bacterium]